MGAYAHEFLPGVFWILDAAWLGGWQSTDGPAACSSAMSILHPPSRSLVQHGRNTYLALPLCIVRRMPLPRTTHHALSQYNNTHGSERKNDRLICTARSPIALRGCVKRSFCAG